MSTNNSVMFVEGKEDKAFIICLTEYLGLSDIEVIPIGGGVSKLPLVEKQI